MTIPRTVLFDPSGASVHAATALAAGLPLYTRDPDDVPGITGIIEVVAVQVSG